jgi:hypothetical protein
LEAVLLLGVELALAAVQRLAVVLVVDTAAAAAVESASAVVQLASAAVALVSLPAMGHLVPAGRTKSVSS